MEWLLFFAMFYILASHIIKQQQSKQQLKQEVLQMLREGDSEDKIQLKIVEWRLK